MNKNFGTPSEESVIFCQESRGYTEKDRITENNDGILVHFSQEYAIIYDRTELQNKVAEAFELIGQIEAAVNRFPDKKNTAGVVDFVCESLRAPCLKENPLFVTTVTCFMD